MTDFTRSDIKSMAEFARAFEGPSVAKQPFRPQIETVLDIPVPPSVNSTRRIDYRSVSAVNKWKKLADETLWANGQFRAAQKGIQRFELHILLDEKKCRLDQDNGVKALVDYLRRLGIIVNDSKKHWRRTVIEWGSAPEGCRVTIKPLEAA